MRTLSVAAALSLSVSACAAVPQPPQQGLELHRERGGEELLSRAADCSFSGAVLVARHGAVLLHDAAGFADREAGIPASHETVFDFGSLTKQFTAAAILRMQEAGLLSTNDSLGMFFPGAPSDRSGITVHQLLTHSSGLPESSGRDAAWRSREELIQFAMEAPLEFPPGDGLAYSNVAYSLLAAIIELKTGEGYEAYLNRNLFAPAGLSRTGYVLPDWDLAELAVGYEGNARWKRPTEDFHDGRGPSWNLVGNGGILSTVGEMHRWHAALRGGALLSPASVEQLFGRHIEMEGAFVGYGWVEERARGTRMIAHTGSNDVFYADLQWYPDRDVLAVFVTNRRSDTAESIFSRIADWSILGGELASAPIEGCTVESEF